MVEFAGGVFLDQVEGLQHSKWISKVNPSRCDWRGPEDTGLCAWLHSALFLPSKATTTASAAHRLERPPVAAPLLSWHCSLVPAALGRLRTAAGALCAATER